jgi:hypothetical protein
VVGGEGVGGGGGVGGEVSRECPLDFRADKLADTKI